MNRGVKFSIIFALISLVLGYPIYQELIEGKLSLSTYMFPLWAFASFLVYGVYVGWIKTGADVVARDRHLMKTGHAPMTRDDEILSQYAYFMRSTIGSVVRKKDTE